MFNQDVIFKKSKIKHLHPEREITQPSFKKLLSPVWGGGGGILTNFRMIFCKPLAGGVIRVVQNPTISGV